MKEVINHFFKDSNLKVLIVGVRPWAIERIENTIEVRIASDQEMQDNPCLHPLNLTPPELVLMQALGITIEPRDFR